MLLRLLRPPELEDPGARRPARVVHWASLAVFVGCFPAYLPQLDVGLSFGWPALSLQLAATLAFWQNRIGEPERAGLLLAYSFWAENTAVLLLSTHLSGAIAAKLLLAIVLTALVSSTRRTTALAGLSLLSLAAVAALRWANTPIPMWITPTPTVEWIAAFDVLLFGGLLTLIGAHNNAEEWAQASARAHSALQETQLASERFNLLTEHSTEAFWIAELPSGRFTYASPAIQALLGPTPGSGLRGLLRHAPNHETLLPIETLLGEDGLSWDYELPATAGSRWLRVRADIVTPKAGDATVAVGVVADITDFRTIERRLDQQERQILRTQKVEAIGRLAAGVAHDFNNLLTIIQLNARLALDEINEDNPARDDIAELLGASQRAARLTDQLLAYSRQQVQTLRTLDVRAETERLLTLMRHVLGPEVRVALHLPPNLPHATADAGQFEQMLTNLLLNARDALGRGGQITITGSAVHTATVSWVRLVVQDDGIGMSPETLARASEPFFTTKPTGQGTGLGLATVFGIVEQSGGRAHITSELGRGTTITLDLPIASGDRTPTTTPLPDDRATRGRGEIVVVDDETDLLTLVCRVLSTAGYTPHAASSAAAARALLNDLPHVDALITDVRMPFEDGKDLARAARQLLPALPILFMSGYAEALDVDEAEGRAFLPKPVTGNDLLLALQGLLGERRTASVVSDELLAQAEDALTRQLTDPGLGDA